jgi:hypothetical protein
LARKAVIAAFALREFRKVRGNEIDEFSNFESNLPAGGPKGAKHTLVLGLHCLQRHVRCLREDRATSFYNNQQRQAGKAAGKGLMQVR